MGRTNSYGEGIRNMCKFWLENSMETITEGRGGEWDVALRRL
jgi:hypothetical protein